MQNTCPNIFCKNANTNIKVKQSKFYLNIVNTPLKKNVEKLRFYQYLLLKQGH